jgi:hypothetical protein
MNEFYHWLLENNFHREHLLLNMVYSNLSKDVMLIEPLVEVVVVVFQLYQWEHNYFHNDKRNENVVSIYNNSGIDQFYFHMKVNVHLI